MKLAFVRGHDVWSANGDGTQQKRLIQNAAFPCWSPDKKRLAFARDNNVWIANADGTGQRPLTTRWKKSENDEEIRIAWNRVDNRIVFSHSEEFRLHRTGIKETEKDSISGVSLFAILANASSDSDMETILSIEENGADFHFSDQSAPAWSKSGKYLAFTRNGDIWIASRGERKRPGNAFYDWEWDITRVAAVALYDDPSYRASRQNWGVTYLSWTPDEKSLIYGIRRISGSGFAAVHRLRISPDRYSFEIDTKDDLLIPQALEPCVSPDGRWIAHRFWSSPETNYDYGIYLSSIDGKTHRKIIADAEQPAW